MSEVSYYSFENLDTGEYQGLLRYDGGTLEYAGDGGRWLPSPPDGLKRILVPGADAPDLIPVEKARELAAKIGVEL